jgi:hypothetical protein
MGGPTPAVNGLLNTRSQITQVTSCGADGPTASLLATQADRAFMAAPRPAEEFRLPGKVLPAAGAAKSGLTAAPYGGLKREGAGSSA